MAFSVHCCSRGRQAPFHALCRFSLQTSCDTKLVILSQNSIYHHQWQCMYQWTLWHLKTLLYSSSLSMLIKCYQGTHREHKMWQLTPNRTLWPTTEPSSSDGLVTWGSTEFNIHIRACAEWISLPDDICPPIDPNFFFRIRTLEISHKTGSCSTLPI